MPRTTDLDTIRDQLSDVVAQLMGQRSTLAKDDEAYRLIDYAELLVGSARFHLQQAKALLAEREADR